MNRRNFLKQATGAATVTWAAGGWEAVLAEAQGTIRNSVSLAGEWAFRTDEAGKGVEEHWTTAPAVPGDGDWKKVVVPGCWERDGQPGNLTGPVMYRRDVSVPRDALLPGMRLWWECDAVSYHAEGYAGGQRVGEHTGMWDAFAWEVPLSAIRPDGAVALALRVEKPGGKRFPIRETMAGFLPYVWGTWGGPWQETRLRVTGPCRIQSLRAPGSAEGKIAVEAEVDIPPASRAVSTVLQLILQDSEGQVVIRQEVAVTGSGTVSAMLTVAKANLWTLSNPALYALTATVYVGGQISDVQTRRVGFRDIQADGELLRLNGKPIFFRAPLSWGWYEETRAPNPPPDIFRRELARIRELGFNGVKLCLWVPPRSYFDIADEMGMLLWVELPMWLPQGTKFCREQTPGEYKRIIQQVGDHPSVALYTLGCEIGEGVDAAFLGELYTATKKQTKGALVRDNSGSAECYGGPLPEHADFWDFHLYCEAQMARNTFDAFAPRWRERQPFLFGEFNDQDALRDLPGIVAKRHATPWWAVADPRSNPQGVRWEYGVTEQMKRMQENRLLDRTEELRASSRHQAWLSRKHTLELVRSYPFMTGYVVTGLVDTPISTAGLFDDFGNARFTPAEFQPFNGDTVLIVEPDRRRAWTNGGDRPAWLDRHGVWAGASVRRHIGVSHFGPEEGGAFVAWEATGAGTTLGKGNLSIKRLLSGTVVEAGLVEFTAPKGETPSRITLTASIRFEGSARTAVNSWMLWVFPKPQKDGSSRRVGLFDPAGHLASFADATGVTPVPLSAMDGTPTDGKGPVSLIVATAWRPALLEFVREGGRLLLIQPGPSAEGTGDGLPAAGVPFWREAMRLFEPHPSWGQFPHEKRTDFCFYGLASDAAFEVGNIQKLLGEEARLEPVLTRVDARSSALHAYTLAASVGAGQMLLTTLRPQGGLGDQPSGLNRHVAGAYLLRTWIDWLAGA